MAALQEKVNQASEDSVQTSYKCEQCKDQGGWIEEHEPVTFYSTVVKDAAGNVQLDEFNKPVYKRLPMKNEIWVTCSCQQQQQIERLIANSQITSEFQKKGFKNFDIEGRAPIISKMRNEALKYYNNFAEIRNEMENSIALVGQVGSGKTHLLSAIANGLLQQNISVMYFPFAEVMEKMRENEFALKDKIVHQAQQADVWFLDDLFKPVTKMVNGKTTKVPRASEWAQERMYEIINYRYLNKKPILLSCELDFETLLQINDAIGSRLFEMCSSYLVTIAEDPFLNHRLRKVYHA